MHAPDRTPPARVLVVDDEAAIRTLIARVLSDAGYVTAVAADAAQALKIAGEQGPFDLFLVDVKMPGMSGEELGRCLRQRELDAKILYVTGFSDWLFDKRPMLWEGEGFLEKPFTPQGLLEAVAMLLYGSFEGP